MEQIYTIPVNEAFDFALSDTACGCPICALYHKLEENELDIILGASMMEPDIRIRTNQNGFCQAHFSKLTSKQNRLSLALMMQSHLDSVKELLVDPPLSAAGDKPAKKINELEHSCYLCDRIENSLSRMIETTVLLWQTDDSFKRKFDAQHRFCLPHYRRLIEAARHKLPKKVFPVFYKAAKSITERYLDKLRDDIGWFCKKFDYRYDDEPWNDAKDSIERTIAFLCADDVKAKEGRKAK